LYKQPLIAQRLEANARQQICIYNCSFALLLACLKFLGCVATGLIPMPVTGYTSWQGFHSLKHHHVLVVVHFANLELFQKLSERGFGFN